MSHLCGSSGTVQVVKVEHILKYVAGTKCVCVGERLPLRWRAGQLLNSMSLTVHEMD